MLNLSRFKEIEIYEYETTERTSIKILNLDGSIFLELNYKEIKNISLDLKCGIVILTGKILSVPREMELSKWKNNRNDLIKKIEIKIVRNGFVKHYILNVGIQRFQEFYSELSYVAVFKHDCNMSSLYYTMNFLSSNLRLDYKVHLPDIRNVSKGSMLNVALAGLGLGIGIFATGGTITIPIAISIVIGTSNFYSAIYDFTLELYNYPEELKGQGDFVKQFVGEVGKIIANLFKYDSIESEIFFENLYSSIILGYGIYSGLISAKTLFNAKNFSKVSKNFEKGYVKFKDVKIRAKHTATSFEGMERSLNKNLLFTDITNSVGAGQSIYEQYKTTN